jgi:hypothetical protein
MTEKLVILIVAELSNFIWEGPIYLCLSLPRLLHHASGIGILPFPMPFCISVLIPPRFAHLHPGCFVVASCITLSPCDVKFAIFII